MLLLPCFTFIFRLPFLFFVYKHFDKRVILVSRESDGFFVWFNLLFKSNFWIFYLLVQVQTRTRLVKKRKSYLLSVDFQRPFSEFIKCYKLVNYKNESKQHASKLCENAKMDCEWTRHLFQKVKRRMLNDWS